MGCHSFVEVQEVFAQARRKLGEILSGEVSKETVFHIFPLVRACVCVHMQSVLLFHCVVVVCC